MAEGLKPARNDVGGPFIFSQSFSRVLHSLARPRNPLHLSSNSPRTCLEETSTPFPPHRLLASSTTPSTWPIQCAQVHNCRLEIAPSNILQPNMDQEKLVTGSVMAIEHRQHNVSPSQKTAMPRWRGKGKEKSTIAHACTWVVDHQISTFTETPMRPPSQC